MSSHPQVDEGVVNDSMSGWRTVLNRFRQMPLSVRIGFFIVGVFVLCAVFAPLISPNPYTLNFANTLLPPSHAHLFGADENGRDLFARCLYGLRLDLLVVRSGERRGGAEGKTR